MNIETLAALADKKIDLSDGVLGDFRKTHLALFERKGMREVAPDSYKFTNLLSFFKEMEFAPQNFEGSLPEFSASFPTITFIDGELSGSDNLPDGVTVEKIHSHFPNIKELFVESNALSHLHHALLNDGLLIEIGKNTEINAPLRILNLLTKSTVSAPTHLIVAHPHSKLTIIEETRAIGNVSHAFIPETYIKAFPGSRVEHISIDLENEKGLNHSSVFAEVEKDASVRSVFLSGSGKLNRKNLTLNLNAPGSHGESYSLFLANGTEHADIYTVINHKSADTTSDQIAKGILDGDSKGVFTGKIHIHPKAQRVASGQLNKNLLLSKKAQVHSQPQLEIFADDVKCSHGSTTGQLSDDEVFYFQARGIPTEKARNLLALGFGLEVVQKIQNKEALSHITAIIREKLAEKFSLGRGL
jgi:Fe-S cluster assembly protein SufD